MPREWMNARKTGQYLGRSPKFVRGEVAAGRLRAARIGGRSEIVTCPEWCDQYIEAMAAPVLVAPRRRA